MASQDSHEITLLIERSLSISPKEFEAEITLLNEKRLSISPKEFDVIELARNFNHNIPAMPTKEDIYKLVIKLKVKKYGDFNDSVVNRIGELLWLTVSEEEKIKISEEYNNLTKHVVEILTSSTQPTIPTTDATNEQSFDEIFYRGIDYIPSINFNNQLPDSIDIVGGITLPPQTNR
ncbi:18500_t:CDS:1 [Dentiscutata erythropus]|uniref:18500_t:CDS:1 n=1 Tax=Dentiscutata erythropus TaxID=1348616 RepID=A0A9N9JB28_9GLOM|nr:18500_t:CDS:1 [Dentiscutata erythropus]